MSDYERDPPEQRRAALKPGKGRRGSGPASKRVGCPWGKGPGTFDCLGFTVLWKRNRRGGWYMGTHTRMSRLRRAKKAVYDWCRRHRHWPVGAQHAALVKRLRGHFNYFGIKGNESRLNSLADAARCSWFKWLNRRSQRSSLTWERYVNLVRDYPLPNPEPKLSLWGTA